VFGYAWIELSAEERMCLSIVGGSVYRFVEAIARQFSSGAKPSPEGGCPTGDRVTSHRGLRLVDAKPVLN
jgi:hypothetical protein